MKTSAKFMSIGISLLFAVGLAACDKPGPAQSTGQKIDETLDKAGKKTGEVAGSVGETIAEKSAKSAEAVADSEITTKVKAAIFAEPGLKTLQISVDTVAGVVTLSGSVDSRSDSDRAKALAGAVAGVKAVENRLVVKPAR